VVWVVQERQDQVRDSQLRVVLVVLVVQSQ
jgi:hypothetical protein